MRELIHCGNTKKRYIGMNLGDQAKRCCLGTGQIRGSIAHNSIVGGARAQKRPPTHTHTAKFSGCRSDDRRIVL